MQLVLPKLLPIILLTGVVRADLVAHYEFTADSELVDSTGLTGDLTAIESGANDFVFTEGYVSFPGSEVDDFDYLSSPNFGFDDATKPWSLQFDIRDPGGLGGPHPTAAGIISSHIDAGADSWQLNSSENVPGAVDAVSTGTDANDGGLDGAIIGSLADENWHTILLIHEADATTVTAYFDGVLVDPTTLGWGSGRVTLKTMTLGTNRGENLQASVELDNVMVWNTAEPPPTLPASPEITDISVDGSTPSNIILEILGSPSTTYDVTASTTLTDDFPTPVISITTDDNGIGSVTFPKSKTKEFYRVELP